MSQLIPLYIAGPFAPGVKSTGEAQSSSLLVFVLTQTECACMCMHGYEHH